MKTLPFIAAAAAAFASPVPAAELIFGLGYSQYGRDSGEFAGENSAVFSGEYRGDAFGRFLGADVSTAIAADIHAEGDAFIGAGLGLRWSVGQRGFIDAGLMPGLYESSSDRNDLGGTLEFRTSIAYGWTLEQGNAVSLAVLHKSNADLHDQNPGMNTLLLRWHREF